MTTAPRRRLGTVAVGSEYTDEEREFLTAMDRYKREHRRPFPSWSEVLTVLKSLGYTKPQPLPPCGMRYHHPSCDCGGCGGDR